MKYLMFPLLVLNFAICWSQLEAKCKDIPPGPPGPPPSNYIGSYSDTTQPIPVPLVEETVIFPNNFAGPVGIVKSASNDSFTVQSDGVYLISWTVNVGSPVQIPPPNSVSLILKVNGIPVLPNPITIASLVGNAVVNFPVFVDLSGQKLLNLQAGDVLTIVVVGIFTADTEALRIDSAMINITEVANTL